MNKASDDGYAMKLAQDSYRWYHDRALACRRGYQIQETVTLIVAAAIPASAVLTHNDARIPAILGGLVVILAGLRPIFHWQENYLRFSGAREAVKPTPSVRHRSRTVRRPRHPRRRTDPRDHPQRTRRNRRLDQGRRRTPQTLTHRQQSTS